MYDVGKEYFSDAFMAYLRQEGILREFLCRHTPQQNGVAEHKNRHILEVAMAIMNKNNLPKSYWAKATNTTVYLMDRCTTSGVHEVTLHEKLSRKKPDFHSKSWQNISPSAKDFVKKLLVKDPKARLTAAQALCMFSLRILNDAFGDSS